MVCIYCGHDTQVANSRHQRRSNQVWRRRRCLHCDSIFTTEEQADLGHALSVHYSPKDLRPFSRDILFTSIYEACKHRKSSVRDAEALTQTAITALLKQAYGGEIVRKDLIKSVAAVLRRFDKTAATVYQAYHP